MKPYRSQPLNTIVPGVAAQEINTAVTTQLPSSCRAIWVGQPGTLSVTMLDGQEVVFTNVEGLLPIRVTEIKAASTADDVVVLW